METLPGKHNMAILMGPGGAGWEHMLDCSQLQAAWQTLLALQLHKCSKKMSQTCYFSQPPQFWIEVQLTPCMVLQLARS